MLDEHIIALFWARSEQAITELDTKYGKTCRKLSYNIVHSLEDAEECVNDAYLGIWNAIPPKHPNPLATFLYKIVRNISIDRYDKNTARKRNSIYDMALEELEEYLPSRQTVEAEIETKELTQIIEQFLKTLSVENRVIFMRRYWFLDSYASIAKRMDLTEKNVSVRLSRIRKKLQTYLEKRGIWL